jgi:RNA polymerase sigma factor (sigma-70 family)
MLSFRSDSDSEQCKLVLFPPKIACSQRAVARLDDVGRLSGAPILRGHEFFSVYHGNVDFGTSPVDGSVPVQFSEPGPKVVVAKVVPPPIGSVYLVQSQLLVVPTEEDELDWLVRHPIDDESERWFVIMMNRHIGECDWRERFDAALRRYIARSRDATNEDVRKSAERARYLAFLLHERLMRKIARQFFPRDEDAVEEAVDVTSVKFLTLQGKFDPSRSCGSYLGRVIRNFCLDQKARRIREVTVDGSQLAGVQDPDSSFESYEEGEYQHFILDLLSKAREEGYLTEEDYSIFFDRSVNHTPFDRISEIYKLTLSTNYQARYAAGQRRVRGIITRIRQYVALRDNGKEKEL